MIEKTSPNSRQTHVFQTYSNHDILIHPPRKIHEELLVKLVILGVICDLDIKN